ncbi:MAG: tripartite tricarboxylate transporter TctB family protein [Pseudolabrys sp.]
MASSLRDRIAGSALLAVALIWIVLVYQTIDPAQGTEAGPRAFPLFFGIVLAILSLVLVLQSFRAPSVVLSDDVRPGLPGEWTAVAMTIGGLVVYGVLLEPLGFIPSTALVVVAVMMIFLRITSPVLIVSMAIGLSLGSYLVFGKLLGTYLPPGQIIPIYL